MRLCTAGDLGQVCVALKFYVKNNPLGLQKHGYPVARSKNGPSIRKVKPQGMWCAGQLCGRAAPMSGALTLGPSGREVPEALVPCKAPWFGSLSDISFHSQLPQLPTRLSSFSVLAGPSTSFTAWVTSVLSEPCAAHHVFMCLLAYHRFSKGSMAKFSVPRYCPSFPSSQDASRQWGC